jgi:hypothetical protein
LITEEIKFYGHPNVLATHPRTIEITKANYLTKEGDCIVGINANKACSDFNLELRNLMMKDNVPINFKITVRNQSFEINGFGNSKLKLSNRHDIVIRTSNFICTRTASIKSDKASVDIPREIILLLQDGKTQGSLLITVNDCESA